MRRNKAIADETRMALAELLRKAEVEPRLAALLDATEADVLAYLTWPREHWRQIWSTSPLEHLNKEVKRRTNVVGIFPNPAAAIRLIGALLAEQHDEWQIGRRYFSAESMALLRREDAPTSALAPACGKNHAFTHLTGH